jgi:hypothetical protein
VNDGSSSNNLATATTTIAINDPSHTNGNSANAATNSDVGGTSSAGVTSDVVWQNGTSGISALTVSTPSGNVGGGALTGDLLWTGNNATPPAGSAMYLSAPDGVGGAAFGGGGTPGLPFTATNDSLLFAPAGNGLAASLQSTNQQQAFVIH